VFSAQGGDTLKTRPALTKLTTHVLLCCWLRAGGDRSKASAKLSAISREPKPLQAIYDLPATGVCTNGGAGYSGHGRAYIPGAIRRRCLIAGQNVHAVLT
jgi:hypothetical protein